MEEYYCKPCNFHTNRLSNFKDHINTQKHIDNPDNTNNTNNENANLKQYKVKLYCCTNANCDKIYTVQSSYINHKKKCNNDSEIVALKKQVQKLEKVIKNKDIEINKVIKNKDEQLDKVLNVAEDNCKL